MAQRIKIDTEEKRQEAIRHLESLDIEKKSFWYECKQYFMKRSLKQNRYYWLILKMIAYETGNDKDDLHEIYGDKFLPKEERRLGDEVSYLKVSTSSLDRKEMTYYIDAIRRHAQIVLNISTPDAEDKMIREIYEHYEQLIF